MQFSGVASNAPPELPGVASNAPLEPRGTEGKDEWLFALCSIPGQVFVHIAIIGMRASSWSFSGISFQSGSANSEESRRGVCLNCAGIMRVLIVDDEKSIRTSTMVAIQAAGHQADTADSGLVGFL